VICLHYFLFSLFAASVWDRLDPAFWGVNLAADFFAATFFFGAAVDRAPGFFLRGVLFLDGSSRSFSQAAILGAKAS
jgi:hypothetical protein